MQDARGDAPRWQTEYSYSRPVSPYFQFRAYKPDASGDRFQDALNNGERASIVPGLPQQKESERPDGVSLSLSEHPDTVALSLSQSSASMELSGSSDVASSLPESMKVLPFAVSTHDNNESELLDS